MRQLTGVRGFRMRPTALHALPEQGLIRTGQPDEPIHDGAQGRDLAEAHTEQRRNEIEAGDGDQPPVESSNDDEHGGE